MITKQVATLGFNLNFNVPSTVEEYDTLAKKVGACLDSAVMNVIYRSVFAKFRSTFADAIENNTGITRLTEPTGKKVKDEAGNETAEDAVRYTETEKKYFDRVCATLVQDKAFESVEAAAASFATLAQTTIDSIVFDPSESEAAPAGPKKLAKAYIAVAEKALAAGKLEALAETLATKLGNWKVEATVDSVARAVSEDQRRKREAQKLDTEYGV